MMCQMDGCINEASEIYMDKETLSNVHVCSKHFGLIMDKSAYLEIEKERIKNKN